MKKRTVALLMAAVLLFGAAVGGTLALLTDKTEAIVNTFTAGSVSITLTEENPANPSSIKMVPGDVIAKDPKITVEGDSEDCYLYVRVTPSAKLPDYITYAVDTTDAWTALEGVANVYYREVTSSADDQEFYVLDGNTVTVKSTVTSDMMETAGEDVKLTFIAYAVQKDNAGTAKEAWTTANFPAP